MDAGRLESRTQANKNEAVVMKYSIFSFFIFIFLVISGPSGAEKRKCGTFSDLELDNLSIMVTVMDHKYRIRSEIFVDGWRKFSISTANIDNFESMDSIKRVISLPIFYCLCGSLTRDSYLYTNPRKEIVFRYKCLNYPAKQPYHVKIL